MAREHGSLWIETTAATSYPPLAGDIRVDVAVVGGGIVGLTAATLLKEAGATVAVVDAGRICEGVSGHTTAKLTSQHGLKYHELVQSLGERRARLYAEANESAIALVAARVREHGIECDLRRLPAYVWAESDEELRTVEEEAEAAQRLGLPARFVAAVPLPVEARGAVRFDDQADFHPRRYLLPLAERLPGDGSHLFEQTAAREVEDGEPSRVETPNGTVTARDVVVATNLPVVDDRLFFAKAFPYRGYAVAAQIESAAAPEGVFINAGSPTRSVRTAHGDGPTLVVVAGDGHQVGMETETGQHYANLEAWARERFRIDTLAYRWSTQDYYPVDGVPFVGRLSGSRGHTLVATGFGGWGMTNGIVAGVLLADAALGRANDWAQVFDATRLHPYGRRRFYVGNAHAARHFVADRLKAARANEPASVRPGEGKVVRVDGEYVAASRDDDGRLHAVSAVCTHLRCLVRWNAGERSWDCPCHGSRFTPDGDVLHGPAVAALAAKPVPQDGP